MRLVLRNCKIKSKTDRKDIAVEDGRIREISDHLTGGADKEIDVEGRLVSPSLVNPHIHLDKCLTGEWVRTTDNVASTADVISLAAKIKRGFTLEDVRKRASRCVELAVKNGALNIRGFADVDTTGGLTAVKALIQVREDLAPTVNLQVVAFPQEGLKRDPGAAELLWKSMELGADVVGGIPWYEYTDDDAKEHIDSCFEIAKHFNKDIHMLVDDTDDPNSRSLEYLAVKTVREGYQGRVAASHCGALSAYNDYYARKVIQLVKSAGITIVSNPHISLMINGRLDKQPVRRGITRVRELLEAGVNVASGQDDVDDPYYPFGKPDMLEVAQYMCHAAQLSLPAELDTVFDMVTYNGAKAMRLTDYGLETGKIADLVVYDAHSVHEALRMVAPRKYVIHAGNIMS